LQKCKPLIISFLFFQKIGHACLWHGTGAYNLSLSGERAQWLADACNIAHDKVKIFGVGNEEPIVRNNTKDEQAINRRVEVYAIAA
jgi:outer membrane protein OmpA-like peptidoglycan-associated protein